MEDRGKQITANGKGMVAADGDGDGADWDSDSYTMTDSGQR